MRTKVLATFAEQVTLYYDVVVRGTAAFKGESVDLAWTLEVTPEQEVTMAPTVRRMLNILREEYRKRQAEAKAEGGT